MGSLAASNNDDLEVYMRIFSNLELAKEKYGAIINYGLTPEGRQDEIESAVFGRRVPDTYLMWDVISTQELKKYQSHFNDGVSISVHQVEVQTSESQPTGSGNNCMERLWRNQRPVFVPKR